MKRMYKLNTGAFDPTSDNPASQKSISEMLKGSEMLKDGGLPSNIDNEAIDNEASARESADSVLQGNIDSEASARENADKKLQSNIDNEASARASADSVLQNNIDNLYDNLGTETARAKAAESTLTTNLNNEITRAKAAEKTNADAIAALQENGGSGGSNDFIIETDLNARFSRVASLNLSGAFSNLPSSYSGKFHLLRNTPFTWGKDYNASYLFAGSDVTEIDHSDELSNVFAFAGSIDLENGFSFCPNLRTISAEYSLANADGMGGCFRGCTNLKTIKLKNFCWSFDISSSTQFEESDLVEIIGNLMPIKKEYMTLTMGATNLAKLTEEEKAVATNKNWILA